MFCILCMFLNDFERKVQIVSFRIYAVFCKLFVKCHMLCSLNFV